jgi:hypothetical protein
MKLQKRADLFLYVGVLLICYSLAGCRKNTNIKDATELSSSSSNANARILSTSGIGGYNLNSTADRVIAFDYEHTGRQDYLLLYRPGQKIVWIVKNSISGFTPVYQSSNGIGGYNLDNGSDKIIAFDYEHTGRRDFLVCYRPGQKIVWILKNVNGVFSPVYQGSSGIGGYNLDNAFDLIISYDYDNSGKQDNLVCYRPGSNICWILKNAGGVFTPVYQSANGIGGYNLDNGNDKIIAFDYEHSGKSNYLAPYRAGSNIMWIQQHIGDFAPVFQSFNGIGGYNLDNGNDQVIAFDFDHTGKPDALVCYRPGSNNFWVVQNFGGTFSPGIQSSNGVGGYNLDNVNDKIIAFDYEHSGRLDYLVAYRPGSGIIWILNHNSGTGFTQVF